MASWIKLENGWGVYHRGAIRVQAGDKDTARALWREWAAKKNAENAVKRAKRAAATLQADKFGAGTSGKRDCWVRAVANTTGLSYDDALEASKHYGYGTSRGEGMPMFGCVKMATTFNGMHFFPTMWRNGKPRYQYFGEPLFPNLTVAKAVDLCKNDGGKWIVGIDGHVFAVVKGEIYDNGRTRTTQRVDMMIKVD